MPFPPPARAGPSRSSVLLHRIRLALALAAMALLIVVPAAGASTTEAAWTTYHGDRERTGNDPETITPLTPSLAWQSPNLGAPIWGQPLIVGSRVYVTTVANDVYALEGSSGQIVWHAGAGAPVPSGALPCGDITPTVGIVGTPVIDPATGVLYAVADTWNGSQAQHVLEGFRISDGERVLATVVDPPGSDPKALLQRTALNLSGSNVVFGFGGNDGDCSTYKGAVVSVPESGGAPSYWQVPIAAPSSGGGAVWATGGPAVDGAGTVYASTGNPNPPSGQEATTYDYSDSVVELNPALGLTGYFEPPTWQHDSNADLDLSSAAPELLPGGLLFQAGKTGTGYLIDEASLAGGAAAVYSHQVCAGAGSFGGDSYAAGVIYMPCTTACKRSPTTRWRARSRRCGKGRKTRSVRRSSRPGSSGTSRRVASAAVERSSTGSTRHPAPSATPRRCRARWPTISPPRAQAGVACSWRAARRSAPSRRAPSSELPARGSRQPAGR